MSNDPLQHARSVADEGRYDDAVRIAWRDIMPAVVAHDGPQLTEAAHFAQSVADRSTGATHDEATRLARYCTACLDSPHESLFERFSLSGLFSRRKRKRCPECAEDVMVDARVCRFCGYRFADPVG